MYQKKDGGKRQNKQNKTKQLSITSRTNIIVAKDKSSN
jgi:hypothetical protein